MGVTASFRWLLLGVVWLVAAALRATQHGVPPVLPLMQADLGMPYALAGILTMVPVALMGLFAVPGGWIVDRIGARRAVLIGLTLLTLGGLLRAWAGDSLWVFVFTALFGAGMGLALPALPAFVRDWFADRPGLATGIYTTGLLVGAALGAFLSGGWLLALTGSWRGTCLAWGGFSLAVAALWLGYGRDRSAAAGSRRAAARPLAAWRNPAGWRAAVFFLTNVTMYYILTSWLPSYYHDQGWDLARAAVPLTVVNLSSIAASLIGPWLSDRVQSYRTVTVGMTVLLVASAAGFALSPFPGVWLWAILAGLGLSGPFAITLALGVDLAGPEQVGSMSGLLLTTAFLGAAVGPFAVGYLRDLLGSFSGGMGLTAVFSLLTLLAALRLPEAPRHLAARRRALAG